MRVTMFDGLTTEEIRDTTLELLLQNERRWGRAITTLRKSFKFGDPVVQDQAGKQQSDQNVLWRWAVGRKVGGSLRQCAYTSATSRNETLPSEKCETLLLPVIGLSATSRKRRRTRRKRKTDITEESTTSSPLPRLRLGAPEGPSRASASAHPKDQAFKTPCLWSPQFHRGGYRIARSYPY